MARRLAAGWSQLTILTLALGLLASAAIPSVGIQEPPESGVADSHPSPETPSLLPGTPPSESDKAASLRFREGTKVTNRVGHFRTIGDRVVFAFSQDGQQFEAPVLENLMLDRVWRVLGESSEPMPWLVSGTVTEYRGDNYLILSRAVVKAKTADGNPPTASP